MNTEIKDATKKCITVGRSKDSTRSVVYNERGDELLWFNDDDYAKLNISVTDEHGNNCYWTYISQEEAGELADILDNFSNTGKLEMLDSKRVTEFHNPFALLAQHSAKVVPVATEKKFTETKGQSIENSSKEEMRLASRDKLYRLMWCDSRDKNVSARTLSVPYFNTSSSQYSFVRLSVTEAEEYARRVQHWVTNGVLLTPSETDEVARLAAKQVKIDAITKSINDLHKELEALKNS